MYSTTSSRASRPTRVVLLAAALLVTNFHAPTQAVADTVVFLDRTDPQFTTRDGVPHALGGGLTGSSTFGTIGSESAHFDQKRVVTELSYIGALAGGSWNDFSFRLGSVNDPLAYLIGDHAASSVGAYSNVSDEILRFTPDSITFHKTVGGVDTFKLTFSNLNFQIDPFQEWTPIIAPFYDNGGINGPGSFHMMADSNPLDPNRPFTADDFIHHRLWATSTQLISEYRISQGLIDFNTSLAFSASGYVTAVPEPSSLGLLSIIGASIMLRYRHRRHVYTKFSDAPLPS